MSRHCTLPCESRNTTICLPSISRLYGLPCFTAAEGAAAGRAGQRGWWAQLPGGGEHAGPPARAAGIALCVPKNCKQLWSGPARRSCPNQPFHTPAVQAAACRQLPRITRPCSPLAPPSLPVACPAPRSSSPTAYQQLVRYPLRSINSCSRLRRASAAACGSHAPGARPCKAAEARVSVGRHVGPDTGADMCLGNHGCACWPKAGRAGGRAGDEHAGVGAPAACAGWPGCQGRLWGWGLVPLWWVQARCWSRPQASQSCKREEGRRVRMVRRGPAGRGTAGSRGICTKKQGTEMALAWPQARQASQQRAPWLHTWALGGGASSAAGLQVAAPAWAAAAWAGTAGAAAWRWCQDAPP